MRPCLKITESGQEYAMSELYFKLQVDAGLKELDEGKGIPNEEVEKRLF